MCWFGEAMCAYRCRLLFSCHQNFAVKKRLCLGHHPSLHTCVSESMHSLIIIFLAVMPAYAITVASTHSCPSSHAMLVHVFVWSTCRIQADGNWLYIHAIYVYIQTTRTCFCIYAYMQVCIYIYLHTHTHTLLTEVFSIWMSSLLCFTAWQ